MTQQRQIGRSAWPKAALVERENELLLTFADRLGACLYGAEWRGEILDSLSRPIAARVAAGSNVDCANMVRDQIFAGLRSGVLRAVVLLTVAAHASARQCRDWTEEEEDDEANKEQIEFQEKREEDNDPLFHDDGAPKQRVFVIKKAYWEETLSPDIEWKASEIKLPDTALLDLSVKARKHRAISEFFAVNAIVRGPILVIKPDVSLRRVINYADAPSDEWLRRYRIYRTDGRLEALVAAWRYLAIASHSGAPPAAADLARRMQEYLDAQGLPATTTSDDAAKRNSGFQEMATLVLEQFGASDLSSSVLVSSNFRKRRPV